MTIEFIRIRMSRIERKPKNPKTPIPNARFAMSEVSFVPLALNKNIHIIREVGTP